MAATRTLEIPFDGGLSQKTDALWLAPGSAAAATNLVKLKTGSFAKRVGFTALSTTGAITGSNPSMVAFTSGRRLLSFNQQLGIIGQDAWTDAIWSFDDASQQPLLLDRTPETYVYPPVVIAGCSPDPGASVPASRVVQADTAVASGYEMHVWGVGDPTGGSGADIWYELRNATTGAVVIQAQVLVNSATHGGVDVPKLIAVTTGAGAPVFVLTYSSLAAGDANIYARVFSTAAPFGPWGAEQRINVTNGDAQYATGIWNTGAYDTCNVVGTTGQAALIYMGAIGGVKNVLLVQLAVTTTTVTVTSSAAPADATWAADTKPIISGFCVRADATNSEIAYSFSWTSVAPLTRIVFGILAFPAFTNIASSSNLLGTPGPITPASINAAIVIAIERLGTVGALTQAYKIAWSPGQTTFRQGDAASAYPFIATYIASPVATVATVAANQPRVTWNAALASRILFIPALGTSYVVAFIPSDLQGSHFVLCDDALVDITTPNQPSGFSRGWFPMRLVANLTPRQSSVQTFSQAMMGLTSPQFSRVAVHWAANPSYAGGGSSVYQTLIPKDNGPITSAPTLYAIDFNSTKSYAPSQLGGNAILAGGCPSAFDGAQCFELGFPHYPVFKLAAAGGGASPGGAYSYIAVYQWTDGQSQIHRSARSVPTSITLANTQGTSIVCAVPGFSARMKAPNASATTLGVGPQANLPKRRNVLVYLYRTTNGGTDYFQCHAPVPVQLDSPTVTFSDDFTLSGDANLISQPLLYGDGSDGTQPGNILDDECPPAFQHAIVHNNRIYGIAGADVWLSKEFTTFAGSGFNESTAFSVDDGPGPLTALGSMDGNLILFKSDRLFVMSGQGPADNGADNDLTPPSRVTSDVGCLDWRSVVATKDGIYFQSQAGRRLLTRDLQVMPIPVVEDLDAIAPTVTSALVHPSAGRILWTQNTNDTSAPRQGFLVANDYVLSSWSSFATPALVGWVSAVVANAASGTTVGLCYYGLTAAGQVYRENVINAGATPYMDAGSFNAILWASPWLKTDGIVGWSQWGNIYLLLTLKDPADLTVRIGYDYSPTPAQTEVFSAAKLAAQTIPGQPQALIRILPINQRAASMQIEISDSSGTGTVTGQGFLLEGLRVEYSFEQGGYRPPTVQQG